MSAAKYMRKSFDKKRLQRYKDAEMVDDLLEYGFEKNSTVKGDKEIVNLFSRDSELSLRRGQIRLKTKGLDISSESIRRYLLACDIKWQSIVKEPLSKSEKATLLDKRKY